MKTLSCNVFITALLLTSVSAVAEDVDITRDLAADATVTVINVAGEIEIKTWGRNEVHLTGRIEKYAELQVTENDQGIHFEVRQESNRSYSDESELYLMIPVTANIVASGVSADVLVKDSGAQSISVDTVSGDVEVYADVERLDLTSVSGDVEFEGSAIRTKAESVSGDVQIIGTSGEIHMSTVSGDADLEGGAYDRAKFETVSGTITASLSMLDGGRLVAESMSGDVVLRLPAAQAGEYRAQSFSGDIRSAFGRAESAEFGPGSHLKHVNGNSGTVIRAESFSGDVHIGHQ